MLLLIASGCSFGLVNSPGDGSSSSTARIDDLSPRMGPPSGGTAVTITGAGFTGDVEVTFGGVPARAITVTSTEELVATTPNVGVEAVVDVELTSDAGTDLVPAGFTFTRSTSGDDTGGGGGDDSGGGDDTGGGDTDTTPSYVGMVAGLVNFDQSIVMCPDCFGTDGAPEVTLSAVFHEPVDGSWMDWLPAENECGEATDLPLAAAFLDVGTPVTLTDGSTTFQLDATSGGSGTTYAATTPSYTSSATYDLSAPGGADLDGFALTDALTTASGFTDLTPFGLGATTTTEAWTARFPSSGATVTWAPTGVASFITVQLDAENRSGTSLGSAICRFADTGSGSIPSTVFTDWPSGSKLAVRIDRWDVTESVLDWEPTIELISRFEMIGTGVVE